LEKSKVKKAGPQKLLSNVISLVRFAIGEAQVLEPFSDTIDHRFAAWLSQQERLGRDFSAEQLEWLNMIKEHIAASLRIAMDDFELAPFYENGGAVRFNHLFGEESTEILSELNEALAA